MPSAHTAQQDLRQIIMCAEKIVGLLAEGAPRMLLLMRTVASVGSCLAFRQAIYLLCICGICECTGMVGCCMQERPASTAEQGSAASSGGTALEHLGSCYCLVQLAVQVPSAAAASTVQLWHAGVPGPV